MKYFLIVFLVACTTTPAPNWRSAWAEESAAWCDYELRCQPVLYLEYFPDHDTCVISQTARACDQKVNSTTERCDMSFPQDREAWLDQCVAGLEVLECGSLFPPIPCFEAFQ